jgi:response regulator RpfG family c-di-GMP phosphodiesterase
VVMTPLRLLESVRFPETTTRAMAEMYEQWNGGGFPDKLSGKDISLGARILSAADTYADLTRNPRNPFRKILTAEEALAVFTRYREKIFDPHVVDVMARILGHAKAESALGARQRILLIEGSAEEATILDLHLTDQGFDVHIARNLAAAREAFVAHEFELVVSDVTLADGDGIAFLTEARATSWGAQMNWVFYATNLTQQQAQKAFSLNALDVVTKPIAAGLLVAKLRVLLEQRAKKRTAGFSGSLSEMALPEIVQAVMQGRKSGKLVVERGTERGEVHFLEGWVADATVGGMRGENAFYMLLTFATGDFSLDPTFLPPARIIQESPEMLLLEGMRRIDENMA